MQRSQLNCFLIILLVILPFVAAAQQVKPSQTKVLVMPLAADIPVLKASPKSTRKPRRASRSATIPVLQKLDDKNRPARLGADQYKLLTSSGQSHKPTGGTGIQAKPKPVLEHLKLTPRRAYTGLGFLTFNRVFNYSVEANQVLFHLDEPSPFACIFATVQVEAGERYLVDFSVSVEDDTIFTVAVGENAQKIDVEEGSHHLLAFLDAAEDGESTMVIFTDTSKYTFYALDITKVN